MNKNAKILTILSSLLALNLFMVSEAMSARIKEPKWSKKQPKPKQSDYTCNGEHKEFKTRSRNYGNHKTRPSQHRKLKKMKQDIDSGQREEDDTRMFSLD